MAITLIFAHMKTIASGRKIELKYLMFTMFSNNRLTFKDNCDRNNIKLGIHMCEIQCGNIYCLYSNRPHVQNTKKKIKKFFFFLDLNQSCM
jgi:hypothetical protein